MNYINSYNELTPLCAYCQTPVYVCEDCGCDISSDKFYCCDSIDKHICEECHEKWINKNKRL